MDLELAGKVVLITGASGGLGREMAVDFAREDARVVVHYRSGVEAAEVVAESIENMGGEAITAQADLTDRSAVQHMLNLIKGEYGGVDVLIHGAIAFEGLGPIEQMAPETWHKMIEVTVTGTYHLVTVIVPYMKQQRLKAAADGRENVSTPLEMMTLLEMIWKGTALSEPYRKDLLAILAIPKDSPLRDGVPEGIEVAEKPGELEAVRCDSGIVMLTGRPYVLCVMTTYLKRDADGNPAIASVSRVVSEHISRLARSSEIGGVVSDK